MLYLGVLIYAVGYVALSIWITYATVPVVAYFVGICIGLSSSILVTVWFSTLRITCYKDAFLLGAAISGVVGIEGAISHTVPAWIMQAFLITLALVSLICIVKTFQGMRHVIEKEMLSGADWWEAGGKLHIPQTEDEQLQAPFPKFIFFGIMPFLMLLIAETALISASVHTVETLILPLACIISALLACAVLPIKHDRALFSMSHRFFLPALAFLILALSAVVPPSFKTPVLMVGSITYSLVYAMSVSGLGIVSAGGLGTLCMPLAGLALVAIGITDVTLYTPVHMREIESIGTVLIVGLLTITAGLFAATPAAYMWKSISEGVTTVREKTPSVNEQYAQRCTALAQAHGLTARETEVLILLGRGHTAAYIAEELVVSESTVRSHRKNIYRKLQVSSRSELIDLIDSFK